jgi:hypothetical protein
MGIEEWIRKKLPEYWKTGGQGLNEARRCKPHRRRSRAAPLLLALD